MQLIMAMYSFLFLSPNDDQIALHLCEYSMNQRPLCPRQFFAPKHDVQINRKKLYKLMSAETITSKQAESLCNTKSYSVSPHVNVNYPLIMQ